MGVVEVDRHSREKHAWCGREKHAWCASVPGGEQQMVKY
uniref:Uncharacterized protein n=1 Tax=Setaria italica TaxID=4555 RepID=K4APD2_SETIT